MSKPRKLLPITEYLMEHVTARMWGYRNPTLYLDRVLRKWFGDMKWNTRHNELVELDEESVYAIMKKPITTDEMVKEICTKFGQRQTEDIYIANGVDNPVKFTNHSADDNYPLATPIKQHAGKIEYASEDVGELLQDWLKFSKDVQANDACGFDWLDGLKCRTEQAIAKFKERYK